MVMTGVAALRICMKLTLKYKYARLPNPRVAACGRGGRVGEGRGAEKRKKKKSNAYAEKQ